MKSLFQRTIRNNFYLLLAIILLKYNCVIDDNFQRNIFEEGNYDLLDVTDNYNLKLVVTTSKSIYTGIPPQKLFETDANLINSTSIITFSETYLLAACLQDSLLSKISLTNGESSPLVNYDDVNVTIELTPPIKKCSLSYADNFVYIGYTKVNDNNITNIVIKFQIINNNEEGLTLDTTYEPKYYIYPEALVKTNSTRQISCLPLKIVTDYIDEHRIVCIFERTQYDFNLRINRYFGYSFCLNDDFSEKSDNVFIKANNRSIGTDFYKKSDTYGRTVFMKSVFDIYLIVKNNETMPEIKEVKLTYFLAETDLADYKNGFLFTGEKIDKFMNKNSTIYYFGIYKFGLSNYFKLYDYKETYIKNLLGYYNENDELIIIFYKTSTNILYFYFKFKSEISNFSTKTATVEMKSFEYKTYDATELLGELLNVGNLFVKQIKRKIGSSTSAEIFEIDYNSFLTNNDNNNNIIVLEKSFNTKYEYNITFIIIDNVEDTYTRIYYIEDIIITVKTCYSSDCVSSDSISS